VGNGSRLEDVAPLDKLYFHHRRFETFYANMERALLLDDDGGKGYEAEAGGAARPGGDGGDDGGKQEGCEVEVVMLRANVHEAPQLLQAAGEGCDLVFIDAEKDKTRLAALLRTVQALFPQAVIVGDDLAFDGVKAALVEMGLPESRVVKREEAYIILPAEGEGEGKDRDKAAVLAVMEGEVAPRLAVPGWQREVVALIGEGRDGEAVALGAAHGLGVGDVLYSPGKSIVHDVCRRRDKAALAFLDGYVEEVVLKGLEAEEKEEGEGGAPAARVLVPVNDVGLTPFDYLTDVINF
jgi:hypothetical protein